MKGEVLTMRTTHTLQLICLVAAAAFTACSANEKKSKTARKPQQAETKSTEAKAEREPAKHEKPAGKTTKRAPEREKHVVFTSENNPTTRAGRGEPSVDDQFRPAAWVFVDGNGGTFVERDGQERLEWMIEGTVSSRPVFRVEALKSFVGDAKDFSCLLRTVTSSDGSDIYYAIKADEGTFELGKDYSLLNPGKNFTIRNGLTRDVVAKIARLTPGQYLIATAIGKPNSGKRVLAVSHFTVAGD